MTPLPPWIRCCGTHLTLWLQMSIGKLKSHLKQSWFSQNHRIDSIGINANFAFQSLLAFTDKYGVLTNQ